VGYDHDSLGYNYKLSNVSAAIGLAQLENVDARLARKHHLWERYMSNLADLDPVIPMPQPEYGTCNYWLSNIGFRNAEQANHVLSCLRKERIEASPLWKPMRMQVINKDLRVFGDGESVAIHQKFISLPSGTRLSDSDVDRISQVVRKHLPVA
jgi:dTDP-4-amino-4,6-dideoxygalactose transaminase